MAVQNSKRQKRRAIRVCCERAGRLAVSLRPIRRRAAAGVGAAIGSGRGEAGEEAAPRACLQHCQQTLRQGGGPVRHCQTLPGGRSTARLCKQPPVPVCVSAVRVCASCMVPLSLLAVRRRCCGCCCCHRRCRCCRLRRTELNGASLQSRAEQAAAHPPRARTDGKHAQTTTRGTTAYPCPQPPPSAPRAMPLNPFHSARKPTAQPHRGRHRGGADKALDAADTSAAAAATVPAAAAVACSPSSPLPVRTPYFYGVFPSFWPRDQEAAAAEAEEGGNRASFAAPAARRARDALTFPRRRCCSAAAAAVANGAAAADSRAAVVTPAASADAPLDPCVALAVPPDTAAAAAPRLLRLRPRSPSRVLLAHLGSEHTRRVHAHSFATALERCTPHISGSTVLPGPGDPMPGSPGAGPAPGSGLPARKAEGCLPTTTTLLPPLPPPCSIVVALASASPCPTWVTTLACFVAGWPSPSATHWPNHSSMTRTIRIILRSA
jgi:hypothetical protein